MTFASDFSDEEACPIIGSNSYDLAVSQHFTSGMTDFTADMGSGVGYEVSPNLPSFGVQDSYRPILPVPRHVPIARVVRRVREYRGGARLQQDSRGRRRRMRLGSVRRLLLPRRVATKHGGDAVRPREDRSCARPQLDPDVGTTAAPPRSPRVS